MCISCVLYAAFFAALHLNFVQCSYAATATLACKGALVSPEAAGVSIAHVQIARA